MEFPIERTFKQIEGDDLIAQMFSSSLTDKKKGNNKKEVTASHIDSPSFIYKQVENKLNTFYILSSNGETLYEVTIDSCTCPHFIYRQVECKHIKKLKKEMIIVYGSMDKAIDVLSYQDIPKEALEIIEKENKIDAVKFSEKFGEDIVNRLLTTGSVFEKSGFLIPLFVKNEKKPIFRSNRFLYDFCWNCVVSNNVKT